MQAEIEQNYIHSFYSFSEAPSAVLVKNPFEYEQRMVDRKIMPLEGTTHSAIVEIESGRPALIIGVLNGIFRVI